MRSILKGEYYDSGFLLSAIFCWGLSALFLLIISSVIFNECGTDEKSLGYASSCISFLAAVSAGAAAGKKRKSGSLYTALITSVVLVTMELTLGFLIDDSAIEPSAIMSIVSFDFAGVMVGTVFFSSIGKKRKKYRPDI